MHGQDYTHASHAVWEAMAAGWEERHAYFETSARPVTDRMVERLAPEPGATVLDLACGTGVVGLSLAPRVLPGGRVLLCDFSAAMVAAAGRQAEQLGLDHVEGLVADAQAMDLPDDAVDGVVCRWGYMLMADPAAALAETRRILRDGGRLAFAVFSSAEENPWAGLPAQVLRDHGHLPPASAGAPGILALADPQRVHDLVTGAGFGAPDIERVSFTWRFDDEEDVWDYLTEAAGALAMVIARLGETERARVREEIAAAFAPFTQDGEIVLPATSLVASAT